ncbi:uncharacterized protein TNCV_3590841 [Trichonephila clavipes]|nr:uncharacterized protein TNCV_3590841 [Trichonephila clavipes]
MMNSTESAKRSSGNRPKKRNFTVKEVTEASMQSAAFKEDVILGNEEKGHLLTKVENSSRKECLKNHNGSAGMMETVGMVRIFQRSLSHRSVRYTSYIGDGDSKTFSSITASNPYGEDITVSKIECVGDVQKNGNSFTKIKTNELQTQ